MQVLNTIQIRFEYDFQKGLTLAITQGIDPWNAECKCKVKD